MKAICLRYLKLKWFSLDNTYFVAQKSTKCTENAENIIQLNKDNKELFGNLIETQKQRRKRNKQEEVLSVSSDPNAGATKKLRKPVKAPRKAENMKNDSDEDQTRSNEEINCQSMFSKTVKDLEITNFPLTNDSRSNASFEVPKTGVISLPRNDPCIEFYSLYPTVTKIISETMSDSSQRALERWQERMIQKHGKEKFALLKQDTMTRGSEFHENVHRKLLGQGLKENISDAVAASIKGLEHIWPLLNSTVAVESNIVHPRLGYRGMVDCICVFRGIPVSIEWKLSDKLKPRLQDTYDAPVQLSAYLGAINYDTHFNFQVNHGLVVIAYTSGVPADAFFLRPKVCEHYWKLWLQRLKAYKQMHKHDSLHQQATPPAAFDFL